LWLELGLGLLLLLVVGMKCERIQGRSELLQLGLLAWQRQLSL